MVGPRRYNMAKPTLVETLAHARTVYEKYEVSAKAKGFKTEKQFLDYIADEYKTMVAPLKDSDFDKQNAAHLKLMQDQELAIAESIYKQENLKKEPKK